MVITRVLDSYLGYFGRILVFFSEMLDTDLKNPYKILNKKKYDRYKSYYTIYQLFSLNIESKKIKDNLKVSSRSRSLFLSRVGPYSFFFGHIRIRIFLQDQIRIRIRAMSTRSKILAIANLYHNTNIRW